MSQDEFFEDTAPTVTSHILIRDVTTGEILINQRGNQKIQNITEEDNDDE